jgi:hypothetical protein
MSQRQFISLTAQKQFVQVQAGWSNYQKLFFLTIQDADDNTIWADFKEAAPGIEPSKQVELFKTLGIAYPSYWIDDLISDKHSNPWAIHHYGTIGWILDDRLSIDHQPSNTTTIQVNVYPGLLMSSKEYQTAICLIIDNNDNKGMSAVNCVKKIIQTIQALEPKHPWMIKEPQWIICNSNSYTNSKEAADYALWIGHWVHIRYERVVQLTHNKNLPYWRGDGYTQ